MATITNPKLIYEMLKNDGYYPGDPRAARIYKYSLAYEDKIAFAVFYMSTDDDMHLSPFVDEFVCLFDAVTDIGLTPAGKNFIKAYELA